MITLYVWRFGYRLSEKERDRAGRDNVGGHAGCWINSYDCGAPDCPMARFDGKPEKVILGKEK